MSSKSTQRLVGVMVIGFAFFVVMYVMFKQPNVTMSETALQFDDGVTLLTKSEPDAIDETGNAPELVPIKQLKDAFEQHSANTEDRYESVKDDDEPLRRVANPGEPVTASISQSETQVTPTPAATPDTPSDAKAQPESKSEILASSSTTPSTKPAPQHEAKHVQTTQTQPAKRAKTHQPTQHHAKSTHHKTYPVTTTGHHGKQYWAVRVGAFKSKSHAEDLVSQLRRKGESAYYAKIHSSDDQWLYRVFLGPFSDHHKAETIAEHSHDQFQLEAVIVPYHS